MPLSSRTTTAI